MNDLSSIRDTVNNDSIHKIQNNPTVSKSSGKLVLNRGTSLLFEGTRRVIGRQISVDIFLLKHAVIYPQIVEIVVFCANINAEAPRIYISYQNAQLAVQKICKKGKNMDISDDLLVSFILQRLIINSKNLLLLIFSFTMRLSSCFSSST